MQLSIGYQLPDEDDSTVAIAADYRAAVGEVYFAPPGAASGRSPVAVDAAGRLDEEAAAAMQEELAALSAMGVGLVLLFNASCYGEDAISQRLAHHVTETVGAIGEFAHLTGVTTTSPFVARVLKAAFPDLEIRASVNMRVGTVKGMQYLSDCFDAFTMQREYNRDLEHIAALKEWCDQNGKRLHLLANSGCMMHCSWQSFHDYLVAHEAGVRCQENVAQRFLSPCWEYLANREHWVAYLQNTWIRPEDLKHYAAWFDTAKLATRMHSRPRAVVAAYARGRHYGSLLDLTEPGYAPLFRGHILDNTRFPADWFERTTRCDKACHRCGYCRSVLEQVLVKMPEEAPAW